MRSKRWPGGTRELDVVSVGCGSLEVGDGVGDAVAMGVGVLRPSWVGSGGRFADVNPETDSNPAKNMPPKIPTAAPMMVNHAAADNGAEEGEVVSGTTR